MKDLTDEEIELLSDWFLSDSPLRLVWDGVHIAVTSGKSFNEAVEEEKYIIDLVFKLSGHDEKTKQEWLDGMRDNIELMEPTRGGDYQVRPRTTAEQDGTTSQKGGTGPLPEDTP